MAGRPARARLPALPDLPAVAAGHRPRQEPRGLATAPRPAAAPRTSPQVDVYSFGLIMWSLWTRQEPWAGMDTRDLAMRVLAGEDPRPPVPGGGCWLGAPSWAQQQRRCGGCQPRSRSRLLAAHRRVPYQLLLTLTTYIVTTVPKTVPACLPGIQQCPHATPLGVAGGHCRPAWALCKAPSPVVRCAPRACAWQARPRHCTLAQA